MPTTPLLANQKRNKEEKNNFILDSSLNELKI